MNIIIHEPLAVSFYVPLIRAEVAIEAALMYLHVPVRVDGLVSRAGPPHTRVSGVYWNAFSLCMCDLEHLTLWMEVVFNAGAPAHIHTCLWLCWCPGVRRPSGSVLLSPPPVRVLRGRPREPQS